jgi:hypothetical protein
MMFKKRAGVIRILVLFALLLLGTSPLFSQFVIEANLGVNLFNIADPKITINATDTYNTPSTGSFDISMTIPNMVAFGITAGAMVSDFLIGGELAYYSGTGSAGTISNGAGFYQGATGNINGNADVSFLRFGPVVRYYFAPAGLRPFVGAAIDYESVTWTPPSGTFEKFTIGCLDLAAMLGIAYDISPNFYLAGLLRFGYFVTVSPYNFSQITYLHETDKASESWGPVSLSVSVGYSF